MTEKTHEFLFRLKTLFHKQRMDRDMAEELAFHHAMLREKLLRQGVPLAEVEMATRRAFGDSRRWHERLRELWQFRSLENLGRDVSFSARLLRKSPGFTAVALLTLALGVGANTTVFSMINGLLLRPLPVPESERLAVIGIHQGGPHMNYSFPAPFFRSLERRHEVFEQVFAYFGHAEMQVWGRSGNENVPGQMVSGGFFPALRTAPLLGRTLSPEDDRVGGDPAGLAVVISENFWQRWFNRAPDVLGKKLRIDNTLFTVVGVMPKRFIGADPLQKPELFVPLSAEPIMDSPDDMTKAGYHGWWLTVMARLQPGATLEQANAQLGAVSEAVLHEGVPDAAWISRAQKNHFHFTAESGSAGFTYVRMMFKQPLVAVFAMCGGILLLSCLNLASLLMARGAARERELATRLAMGATRRRLVQQLLVESLLVTVLGTAAGLALAPVVGKSLGALLLGGEGTSIQLDTSLDIRVFGFAALAAVVAAMLIGLVPALQATSGNLSDHIKDGQHATQAHERRRILPRALMSLEVALALMLVVGAGLLASSLVKLYRSGAGFDPRGVENIAFSMDKQPLKGEALMQFYRELGNGLSHQPGVTAASFAMIVPLTHRIWDDEFTPIGGKAQDLDLNAVAPDYFEAMRIPMLAGRDVRWTDTRSTGMKIILNRAAANLLLPGREAVGQHLFTHDDKGQVDYEVIGVVGDAKYEDMRSEAPAGGYIPLALDDHDRHSYNAVVRMDGAAAPLAGAARALATRMAPGIPAPVMTSMTSVMDDSLSAERLMALLSVFFAGCALFVTAIGLYGTLAYAK
jgi:putative ABC transport system permease protein